MEIKTIGHSIILSQLGTKAEKVFKQLLILHLTLNLDVGGKIAICIDSQEAIRPLDSKCISFKLSKYINIDLYVMPICTSLFHIS